MHCQQKLVLNVLYGSSTGSIHSNEARSCDVIYSYCAQYVQLINLIFDKKFIHLNTFVRFEMLVFQPST